MYESTVGRIDIANIKTHHKHDICKRKSLFGCLLLSLLVKMVATNRCTRVTLQGNSRNIVPVGRRHECRGGTHSTIFPFLFYCEFLQRLVLVISWKSHHHFPTTTGLVWFSPKSNHKILLVSSLLLLSLLFELHNCIPLNSSLHVTTTSTAIVIE